MSKVELKPCPFRIHGERRESLTIAGKFYYNETFMPCMGKECACYKEDAVDAYCERNGAHMLMTKEVMELVEIPTSHINLGVLKELKAQCAVPTLEM